MTVKLSLHPVILGEKLSFEQMLDLARRNGYEGVDAGLDVAMKMGAADFGKLCDQYGVQTACWGLGTQWRTDEDTFQEGLKALPAQAKAAAEIGCTRCCTWIPPGVEGDAAETRKTWMRRWGEIAKVLGEYGHRFGLEWVAPQHTREGKNIILWRMTELLELEAEIGEPNLGLLVDSFHWYNAKQTVADLEALRPEQVVHVHLNDAPDRTFEDQRDGERLTPGEGIIDLVGFLSALKKIGYQDYMGVEIFSAELKALPAEQAAAHVAKACAALLAQVK
jgi:sugar phosphate isomerase/epimerase